MGDVVIGSITEIQEQDRIAELAKRVSVAVPQPAEAHVSWAKSVLGLGYGASTADRLDARRIMDAAGLDSRPYDATLEPDSAPPGARDVAAAHLERERAEAEAARHARKSFADRGAELGPGDGMDPGRPRPEAYDRPYLDAGHGEVAPAAEGPRPNPVPVQSPGTVQPVALPGAPTPAAQVSLPANVVAARVPQHIAQAYSLGSPSER